MGDTLFGNLVIGGEQPDDGQLRRMGWRAVVDAAGTITRVRYRVPTTGRPSTTCRHLIKLNGSQMSNVDLNAVTPAPTNNAWMEVAITPITVAVNDVLVVWAATLGGRFQLQDPSSAGYARTSAPAGMFRATQSRYDGAGAATDEPTQVFDIDWPADIVLEPASVTGTLQAAAQPGVLAAAGAVINPGTMSAGISGFSFALAQGSGVPGLGTPGGAVLVPSPAGAVQTVTAGGTVLAPTPSGRP